MKSDMAITNFLTYTKSIDGIEIIKIKSPVMQVTDKIIILNISTNTVSFRFKDATNFGCTEKTLVVFLQEAMKTKQRELHDPKHLEIIEKLEDLKELFEDEEEV